MIENLPAEIYGDIKNAIIAIAEGLKVPAEMLLQAIIKQGVVDSISKLCIIIFLLVVAIIVTRIFLPFWKKYFNSSYSSDGEDFFCAISIFLTIVLWIAFFVTTLNNVNNIVTGFVNPEYRAIEMVLDLIKEKPNNCN